MDNFESNPLACEGIIGDGCGGGRWFFVENETLFAYDPITKENLTLTADIKKAKKISKKNCIITIECEDEKMEFDLSKMQKNH